MSSCRESRCDHPVQSTGCNRAAQGTHCTGQGQDPFVVSLCFRWRMNADNQTDELTSPWWGHPRLRVSISPRPCCFFLPIMLSPPSASTSCPIRPYFNIQIVPPLRASFSLSLSTCLSLSLFASFLIDRGISRSHAFYLALHSVIPHLSADVGSYVGSHTV